MRFLTYPEQRSRRRQSSVTGLAVASLLLAACSSETADSDRQPTAYGCTGISVAQIPLPFANQLVTVLPEFQARPNEVVRSAIVDLGDGTRVELPNSFIVAGVPHSYQQAGEYMVKAAVHTMLGDQEATYDCPTTTVVVTD